ncbi:MAG: 16S rRNA pseudouridine(516) synthase [Zoogloeaceae bacterium]|jgi:16S rRNA pseudouridine516 synthase|nr:16S rRNA pseudouridine(516) synthase [Zoogloeaceae bacterium]
MRLERFLQQQGFGTRRECRGLIRGGRFAMEGEVLTNPFHEMGEVPEGCEFTVDGEVWPYHAKALVMLNKPAGYECSRQASHHPGVHALLPPQFSRRGLECVGRLDAETTGLLLLTDDGQLQHRLISPRHDVPKRYRAALAEPLPEEARQKLLTGVVLKNETVPAVAKAADLDGKDARILYLTLTEGRYHQARRMLAAVGNHVVALCRVAIGRLELPSDLPEGGWRWISRTGSNLLWDKPS